jgi:hypothetical protein
VTPAGRLSAKAVIFIDFCYGVLRRDTKGVQFT